MVVAITGNVPNDVVTQEDLESLAGLQAGIWQMERAAHQAADRIEHRIQHGAEMETGKLTFDSKLRMARSRKAEDAEPVKKKRAGE